MKRPAPSTAGNWFWPIVIALLGALAVIWLFAPIADSSTESAVKQTPSPEWTTAPEGPAVPVDLPDAPMRQVPAEQATTSRASPPPQE